MSLRVAILMIRKLVNKYSFLGYRKMVNMSKDYVNTIKELNTGSVYIKDREKVNGIINDIVNGGQNSLQVILDFDRTITKQHHNGVLQMSSFALFEHCPSLPEWYKKKVLELNSKYKPIEYDPKIPTADKRKHMEDWWRLSEEIVVGLTVSNEEIHEVVKQVRPVLRDDCAELFQLLYKDDIPVLVFSAGLGQTVEAVLELYGIYKPNVKVVANFLNYDNQGVIQGFKDDTVINVYNKNESVLKGSDYYNKLLDRVNAIVVGDSIGDATMFTGAAHANAVLKIGFLYEHAEENLPHYMDVFDIVLKDDQTMNVVHAILRHVS